MSEIDQVIDSSTSKTDIGMGHLDDLPPEILQQIPARCIDCSTARSRAYTGHLDRIEECEGLTTKKIQAYGAFITVKTCPYPTGSKR